MLFGENFGSLAKERLEAAAALTKTLVMDKPHSDFHKGHSQKQKGCGGGSHYNGHSKQRGWQPSNSKTAQKLSSKKRQLTSHVHNLSHVSNHSLNFVTNIQLQGSQTYHIKALIKNMNLLIGCPSLAGRVSHFLPNWEVLTQDQWVSKPWLVFN